MLKPLTVWITTNCGKFLKRWEYLNTLSAFWEACMQVKERQLEPHMEQRTGSQLGRECATAVCYHPAYLTSVHSAVCFVAQLCPALCDCMDYSLPGSSVHGDSPGKKTREGWWNWLPCPPPGDLPNPGIEHSCPSLQVDSLLSELLGKPSASLEMPGWMKHKLESRLPGENQ